LCILLQDGKERRKDYVRGKKLSPGGIVACHPGNDADQEIMAEGKWKIYDRLKRQISKTGNIWAIWSRMLRNALTNWFLTV